MNVLLFISSSEQWLLFNNHVSCVTWTCRLGGKLRCWKLEFQLGEVVWLIGKLWERQCRLIGRRPMLAALQRSVRACYYTRISSNRDRDAGRSAPPRRAEPGRRSSFTGVEATAQTAAGFNRTPPPPAATCHRRRGRTADIAMSAWQRPTEIGIRRLDGCGGDWLLTQRDPPGARPTWADRRLTSFVAKRSAVVCRQHLCHRQTDL